MRLEAGQAALDIPELLKSDIRSEAVDLKTSKKRVRRNVWHNIEARF